VGLRGESDRCLLLGSCSLPSKVFKTLSTGQEIEVLVVHVGLLRYLVVTKYRSYHYKVIRRFLRNDLFVDTSERDEKRWPNRSVDRPGRGRDTRIKSQNQNHARDKVEKRSAGQKEASRLRQITFTLCWAYGTRPAARPFSASMRKQSRDRVLRRHI